MILEGLGIVAYRAVAIGEVGEGNVGGPSTNLEFFADWFRDVEGEGFTFETWYDLRSAFSFEGGCGWYSCSVRRVEWVREDWFICNGYCQFW